MAVETASTIDHQPSILEQLQARRWSLSEFADVAHQDVESWSLEELRVLEEKIVRRLNTLGHEYQTTEALLSRHSSVSVSPERLRQQVLNHLRLSLFSEIEHAARHHQASEESRAAERRVELGRRRLNERYDEWMAASVSPEALNDVQAEQVEHMHRTQRAQTPEEQAMYEYTKKTEPVLADWFTRLSTLGPDVRFSPSAERDDYRNGVDFYAHIPVQQENGTTRTVILGIDYTIATRDQTLKEKMWRNFQRPNRAVMHSTIGEPRHQRPPVQREQRFDAAIVALDKHRVDDMTEDLNLVEAHDARDEAAVKKLLAEYETDPVLQYLVPLSIREQITTQLESLHQQAPTYLGDRSILLQAIKDHEALQVYFDELLDQRKNLQAEAEEVLHDERMYRSLRVGDRLWHQQIIAYPPQADAVHA